MFERALPRIGAACGILFAVVLFVTAGTWGLRGVALAALVLFVPFLACLYGLLRDAEGVRGWLSTTVLAAGLAAITLKLASVGPEIAIHRAHIAQGTTLHAGLQGIADALTDVCLLPFGVMAAAAAVIVLRTAVLPRWLGYGGLVTAIALAANCGYNLYRSSGFVPALLLFILWTLATGVVLLRRSTAESHAGVRPYAAVPS